MSREAQTKRNKKARAYRRCHTPEFKLRVVREFLEERVPALGLDGVEDAIPAGVKAASEQVALHVRQVATGGPLASADLRPGDLLIEFGGEPFFRGRGAIGALRHWLIRELRNEPAAYTIIARRDGREVKSIVRLKLGPYVEPGPASR